MIVVNIANVYKLSKFTDTTYCEKGIIILYVLRFETFTHVYQLTLLSSKVTIPIHGLNLTLTWQEKESKLLHR